MILTTQSYLGYVFTIQGSHATVKPVPPFGRHARDGGGRVVRLSTCLPRQGGGNKACPVVRLKKEVGALLDIR